jgi:pSer/pThr/pTyr-binding forkhead associated (FHA) protein
VGPAPLSSSPAQPQVLPLAATALAPRPDEQASRRPSQRPVAPQIDFGPRERSVHAVPDLVPCPACGANNQPPVRFCVSCGRLISAAAPPGHAKPASRGPTGTVDLSEAKPGPLQEARLVLVSRDGGEGPSFPLRETTDIGRTEGAILLGEDRYVSPRHARITLRGGAYYLRDLGSTNGVFFRIPFATDAPRQAAAGQEPTGENEQELEDQDLFLVGQQVLRFEVVRDAEDGFGLASDNGTFVFGTPASPRFARLTQRTVEGVVRDVYHVRKQETVLGREASDVVFPDDPFLSRRHAVVRVHDAGPRSSVPPKAPRRFTLSDLGSSNGTFLQLHQEIRLRRGDQFRIGQQLFRFELEAPHGA